MRVILMICLLLAIEGLYGQSVVEKLERSWTVFANDDQLRHAIVGFSVADSKTGKTVFQRNAQIGLAPASTQKIITSVAAFELLGKDFKYETEFGYDGTITNGVLNGSLYLLGSGDPTLGSGRWDVTKAENVLNRLKTAINKLHLKKYSRRLIADCTEWEEASVPDGWIWQDIGNYYGAYASVFNWRENQFDVLLRSPAFRSEPVTINGYSPHLYNYKLISEVKSAAKGTGDNAYIYYPLTKKEGVIKGTIPLGQEAFRISGSYPDPLEQLMGCIRDSVLKPLNISVDSTMVFYQPVFYYRVPFLRGTRTIIHKELSPTLDSINFYFLRKSINLYGEALIKTISHEKTGSGSTEKGIDTIKNFFVSKGIEKSALNIMDGSGLSPQNRVTADAMVKILLYARGQPWFDSFCNALPEFNGMKMKSGSIGGVRAYTGYHKATSGKEYSFSLIVNNFDGSSAEIVKKIYKLLDSLK